MTAETAVVLPVLVILLSASLAALTAVEAQVRCVDAARIAARAAARGESVGAAEAAARSAAPRAAAVTVSRDGGLVRVRVAAHLRLGPRWLGDVEVSATSVASDEASDAGAQALSLTDAVTPSPLP